MDEKMQRKLLTINPAKNSTTRIIIRFVTEGDYDQPRAPKNKTGYTLWSLRQDGIYRFIHYMDIDQAVAAALDVS